MSLFSRSKIPTIGCEYTTLRVISSEMYYKYNLHRFIDVYNKNNNTKIDEEICKTILYNIILDIVNEEKFDYIHHFSKQEIQFILDFEIDKILLDIIKNVMGNLRK